jgi:hypothetical protein
VRQSLHNYADFGEVRPHYVTADQGPAVVLLHRWPQTWFMWRDIIPAPWCGKATVPSAVMPNPFGRSR